MMRDKPHQLIVDAGGQDIVLSQLLAELTGTHARPADVEDYDVRGCLPDLDSRNLRQPVGQHGPRRRHVDHVCAAILLAQPVVGCAGVEDEKTDEQSTHLLNQSI